MAWRRPGSTACCTPLGELTGSLPAPPLPSVEGMTENSENHQTTGFLRPLLWIVLIVSAAANAVTSSASDNVFIGASFGLVTLASAAGLVVHHYRRRAR